MLVRLVYASRASRELSPQDLQDILRRSRDHNPAEGITGLLWYNDGVFIQVLEGGRDPVNARYKRIVMDNRHDAPILLTYQEISERRYAGWSMGQVNLHRLNPGLLLKYGETQKLDPYRMSGAMLTALFDELVSSGAIECA
ncbi:BLUF domain-containing protein [Roseateles amylovorans]|jgi:Sensors of blue-light using FAD|uniref:BLUF domain-containing protein n=1 Tax=Roseateles amylovorans TaxID=2978473 RepID=A0ABY6AYR3_9BURK|nr:BLUF domain-containing protein [Roseateles amylovorans]UXH78053.1 BLUF domain-containing protein [Roseateles amylovorans]